MSVPIVLFVLFLTYHYSYTNYVTKLTAKTEAIYAYKWCLKNAKQYIPESEILHIIHVAQKYDNWKLILAIIQVESSFDRYVVSNKNASGLMQVTYKVWGQKLKIRSERALFTPEINIRAGYNILNEYLIKSNYDINDALFKYVGKDKGRKYEKKVLQQYASLSLYIKYNINKGKGKNNEEK